MRSSSKSLKTVSFDETPRTTDELKSSLLEEGNNEEPVCENPMTKYVLHYMVCFILIVSGIWLGIFYLTKNA